MEHNHLLPMASQKTAFKHFLNYKTLNMKKFILLTTVFFCCYIISYAQPGQLDPSFGTNGIVAADLGPKTSVNGSSVNKVLLQPDGSMYFLLAKSDPFSSANTQYFISKRLPDGSIDMSYGVNGYSKPTTFGFVAATQADGKIVVMGSYSGDYNDYGTALARYNTDGTFDSTFGGDGTITVKFRFASSIAIQSDGKILEVGINPGEESPDRFYIARYNTDGSNDDSFASGGIDFSDNTRGLLVTVQSDGKIVAVGSVESEVASFSFVARYNANGGLDMTFSEDGIQTTKLSEVNAIAIQSDGKIVVAGSIYTNGGAQFSIARYNNDGTLDNSFSDDGMQATDFSISAIAVQQDDKLLVAGNSDNNFRVARYNVNGSLDNSFSGDGKQITDFGENDVANSVAVGVDGKLVVAGSSGNNYAAARFDMGGNLDNSFDTDGKLTGGFSHGLTSYLGSAVQKDGKLVTVGFTWNGSNNDFLISRYNTDGSLDNTFSSDGFQLLDFASTDDKANSVALQDDGKIIVAGSSAGNYVLLRLNINGGIDNTFSGDGKIMADFKINSIAIQSDGKIVAGGAELARYEIDGSPDVSFNGDGKVVVPFEVNDIAIQTDGKIIGVGRYFSIARFNSDGSLDNSFDEDGIQANILTSEDDNQYLNSEAASVLIQEDGKLVMAGNNQETFKIFWSDFAHCARYKCRDKSFE